jgi:cation diffusion facilitator family transporter
MKIDKDERYRSAIKATMVGMWGNVIMAAMKLFAGFIAHSQSLIADGLFSIADIINSTIAFIGTKIAHTPKDDEHPYGHGKAETVGAQFMGLVFCFVAIKILWDSIENLLAHKSMEFQWWVPIVPLIVVVVKFFMYLYVSKIGKKYSNPLVSADAQDHLSDIFVSFAAFLGTFLTRFGLWWIDSAVGILISIWLIFVGIKIVIKAIQTLMDQSLDAKTIDSLKAKVRAVEGVREVNSLITKPIGIDYLVEVKVSVDCFLSIAEGHIIADRVKAALINEDSIHSAIIHINPYKANCTLDCATCPKGRHNT